MQVNDPMLSSKISRPRPVEEVFRQERVGCLSRTEPAIGFPETPLTEVLRRLRGDSGGCVIIVEPAVAPPDPSSNRLPERNSWKPVGILTERDYLDKIAGKPPRPGATAAAYMTPHPRTISADESLDAAIQLMTQGGYRHLPLVDRDGGLAGVLSVRDIIFYLAELFPTDVMNLPPRLHQRACSRREGE